MIYSVYNYGTHAYDYFEGPTVNATHAPVPPKGKALSSLGVTVDQAAWPVPAGAKKIGSGYEARGRIAAPARGGMGDFSLSDLNNGMDLVYLTLSIVGIWLWIKKERKS